MICFLTLLLAIPGKAQAPPDSDPAPLVTISLPTSVTSDTVQIRYFLIGPFGGRSDYVKSGVGLRSYQIRAYPEQKAAQSVKIVIYAPACEFQTLDLAFSGNKDRQEDFVCRPLRSIKLAGQFPQELVENENTELLVTYIAYWMNRFFGIMDGFVPQFTVARTQPNTDGSFAVDIPDFTSDPSASSSDDEQTGRVSLSIPSTADRVGLSRAHAFSVSPPPVRGF